MKVLLVTIMLAVLGLAGATAARSSTALRLAPAALVCPAPSQPAPVALDLDYFKGYLSDTGTLIGSAVRWRPSSWLKMSLGVLAMSRLIDEEDDVQMWVQDHRTAATDRMAGFARCLGDGRYVAPALSAVYCYGRLQDDLRAERTALLGLESFALSGALCEGIKLVTHKHRPVSSDLETEKWSGPSLTTSNLSFPSGHSATAFAVATVIASEYGTHRLVPPLAYCAASLCAVSRINDNAHWTSDVLIGSAVGYLTARAIVGLHGDQSRMRLAILPSLGLGRADLAVSCRF